MVGGYCCMHLLHMVHIISLFCFRMRNLMMFYLNKENKTLVIIPIVAVTYMGPLYLFVVSTFFLASFVDPGIYPRGMLCGLFGRFSGRGLWVEASSLTVITLNCNYQNIKTVLYCGPSFNKINLVSARWLKNPVRPQAPLGTMAVIERG